MSEKIKESLSSVLPVTLIVLALLATVIPVPASMLLCFLIGGALLIVFLIKNKGNRAYTPVCAEGVTAETVEESVETSESSETEETEENTEEEASTCDDAPPDEAEENDNETENTNEENEKSEENEDGKLD